MLRSTLAIVAYLAFTNISLANVSHPTAELQTRINQLTLPQLEARLSALVDAENSLAPITLRHGVGNLGWESQTFRDPAHNEWLQIELAQECVIQQVVLVPILSRNELGEIESDGFPIEFKILIGKSSDDAGVEVASFTKADNLLPRIAPVVVPIRPTRGKWIRIEATKLMPRELDGKFLFQLSEVMVFSDEENVALGCKTSVSSVTRNRVNKSTRDEALVDGFTPYLMTAAQGEGSKAFVGFFLTGPQVKLTFDLGEPKRIHRIHLHAADRSQNVPQIQHSDYAMPNHFVVMGSHDADFSDAVKLFEYRKTSIYDSGPIVMARFEPQECQFVRLIALEAYKAPEAREAYRCIGFAEIEIFDEKQNLAAGVIPTTDIQYVGRGQEGRLSSLTDERNDFGRIISIKEWITQLSRRHDLTLEISMIKKLVKDRYASQSRNFRSALGLIAFLILAIITTILIARSLRARETNQLKERFAADLHDEVGADLYTIALLSDLAKEEQSVPERLHSVLEEILCVSKEASASVRHVTEAKTETPYVKLPDLMKQAAARIVIGIDHKIDIQGLELIESLRPQTRAHILLFFKECLVNVSRHADASALATTLKVAPKEVHLTIQDNGHGIPDSEEYLIPPSLVRRAKLLGAKVDVQSSAERGTSIHLQFNRVQWNPFKKR
ncbi:histidine kinase [bacterium]|nr:histidine kinase [bacterium]